MAEFRPFSLAFGFRESDGAGRGVDVFRVDKFPHGHVSKAKIGRIKCDNIDAVHAEFRYCHEYPATGLRIGHMRQIAAKIEELNNMAQTGSFKP